MQETDNFLSSEFELVILSAVILLIVICFGSVFFKSSSKRNLLTTSSASAGQQAILANDSFAFLTGSQEVQLSRNPFHFHFHLAPPKVEQAPAIETESSVPAVVAPVDKSAEIPAEEAASSTPAAPGPPQFRLLRQRLSFMYSQADSTGKTSAVLKVINANKESALLTVGVGERVKGMTILAINAEQLRLLDASGKQVNISFGDTRNVVVQEQIK